jgi:hypothetical protein
MNKIKVHYNQNNMIKLLNYYVYDGYMLSNSEVYNLVFNYPKSSKSPK